MTNTELREMMDEQAKRDQERKNKMLQKIKEAGFDVNDDMVMRYDFCDGLKVFLNNKKYVYCNSPYDYDGYVSERKTDFGHHLEFKEEYNEEYVVMDFGWKLAVIDIPDYGDKTWVYWFRKDTGSRIKGQRKYRKFYETSKGKYIVEHGRRHYFEKYDQ